MKYVDEFRDASLCRKLANSIRAIMPEEEISLMEVCGSHTQSFFRFGLDKLLPPKLKLIAGPGCPVCVSSPDYIDQAIELSQAKQVMILSFGDMLRVPGSCSSLEKEKARSSDIRIVYSPLDAVSVAKKNPNKKVIFLAVGFETTAPAIALSILQAKKEKIKNLFFFSSLKLIPPAIAYLIKDKRLRLHGFLCPGHVSSIIGAEAYAFIPKKYGIACCVAGFEPVDILEGIYLLLKQIVNKKPRVENQYLRAVSFHGNLEAKNLIKRVFKISTVSWRGLGRIPKSGLEIKDEFREFDAGKIFPIRPKKKDTGPRRKCRCADILKGLIGPLDCPLFSRICNPENPLGPCMVSHEGACNAYYRYH